MIYKACYNTVLTLEKNNSKNKINKTSNCNTNKNLQCLQNERRMCKTVKRNHLVYNTVYPPTTEILQS